MKRVLLVILYSLLTSTAYADSKLTVGGTVIRDTSSVFTTAFDHSKEYGPWQHAIEGTYIYNEKNSVRTRNEGYGSFKENYSYDERNYAVFSLRYDYDEFRADGSRTILGAGHGFKILRTDRIKMSNELTLGSMRRDHGWEPVVSNSLWFSYKVAQRVTLVNKFLIDQADERYIRNRTELNYRFDEGFVVGVSNLYTRDPEVDNITTFNVGTTF